MDEHNLLIKAEKRVKAKKGFYWHLSVYLGIAVFFFTLNMAVNPEKLFFFFPLIPWGFAILMHYIGVFGIPGTKILSEEWEKEQLQKEVMMLREKQRQKEDILLLEQEDEMMNINEKDYIKMKEMRQNYREL